MAGEEEVGAATKLVTSWKEEVVATFPEGSLLRSQLEESLNDATERIAKVDQSLQMRKQIDCLPDGPVKQHMSKALSQLEGELGIGAGGKGGGAMAVVQEASAGSSSSWELKVVVQRGDASQTFVFKDLHPDSTVGVLKALVEELAQVPMASQQICYSPSSQPLPGDDSCPLKTLSVRNRDTLIARVMSGGLVEEVVSGDEVVKAVMAKAERARVKVKGPRDALALAVHVILLSEGFTAMAAEESGNGPKGFAPPVRPVPETRLVPTGWNTDPTSVIFMYRHEQLRGRDIRVTCLWLDEAFLVEAVDPKRAGGGGPLSLRLDGSRFVDLGRAGGGGGEESPGPFYKDLTELAKQVKEQVVEPLWPKKVGVAAPPPPSNPGLPGYGPVAPMEPGRPPFQGQPPFPGVPVPHPGLGPFPVPGVGGYGARAGGLVPDFEGDLQPGGGFGPGGGNLMGPNHPIFSGQQPRGMFPGGGLGMPGPRFDPYGPVIPPTRGGPPRGVDDPNDPRGRRTAFREPDPDHLPPPCSDNMYL